MTHRAIAEELYEQARADYPTVGVRELALAYARHFGPARRPRGPALVLPEKVIGFSVGILLTDTLRRLGPTAADVLRVNLFDPACGVGEYLAAGARLLARTYAVRLVGQKEPAGELVNAVLPHVILRCVFGTDPDPVAVDLARLALSLQTGGVLPVEALSGHIASTEGGRPPALAKKSGGVDVLPEKR